MASKPTLTIVGPGRLGAALTLALDSAGYPIREIVTRPRGQRRAAGLARRVGANVVSCDRAQLSGEIVWLCVPDTHIRDVAHRLASAREWRGKYVFHSSGALPSSELVELKKRGAGIASVHPMMSFVHNAAPRLHGVSFAVEGDANAVRAARRIVKKLGGEAISIAARNKPLYHTFGAFASPMLISVLAVAEEVGRAAGLSRAAARKAMLPIVVQTIRNYEKNGAAGAFSGPIIRGDVETVRKNLESLKSLPEAQRAYVALGRAAVRYLPAGNRKKLEAIFRKYLRS